MNSIINNRSLNGIISFDDGNGGVLSNGSLNVNNLTTQNFNVSNTLTVGGNSYMKKIIQDTVLKNVYLGDCFSSVNTGQKNTVIGTSALSNNTTGSYNFAIGYRSMELNTTGSYNNALGTSALSFNTTGKFNVAIGESALISNQSGSYNTAVGYGSLPTNLGDNNTAIGRASLSNSYFNNNTGIGANAGLSGQGNNNTFIGMNSDMYDPLFNYNFNNSTAVGYGALMTASNQVKLGTLTETVQIDGTLNVNNGITGNITGNITSTGTSNINNLVSNTISGNITSSGTSNFNNVNSTALTTSSITADTYNINSFTTKTMGQLGYVYQNTPIGLFFSSPGPNTNQIYLICSFNLPSGVYSAFGNFSIQPQSGTVNITYSQAYLTTSSIGNKTVGMACSSFPPQTMISGNDTTTMYYSISDCFTLTTTTNIRMFLNLSFTGTATVQGNAGYTLKAFRIA